MGFAVPLAQWFRNDLKEFAQSVIFSRNGSSLVNQGSVHRVWEEHQSGLRNRSTELWTLLMFRLWEQQFMAAENTEQQESHNRSRLSG
jgi:asparagine synthase (glutamine-hydrolysing)